MPAIFVEGVYLGGRESLSKLIKNKGELEILKHKIINSSKHPATPPKFKDLI
jgi:hypothetical protein